MSKIETITEAELALKESVLKLIDAERNFMDTRGGQMNSAQTHEINILANDSIILKNTAEVLSFLKINLKYEDQ